MSADDLIRMANQIAAFAEAYPEDEAVAMVADHIAKFWARGMRDEMAALLAEGVAGLTPLAERGARRALEAD